MCVSAGKGEGEYARGITSVREAVVDTGRVGEGQGVCARVCLRGVAQVGKVQAGM